MIIWLNMSCWIDVCADTVADILYRDYPYMLVPTLTYILWLDVPINYKEVKNSIILLVSKGDTNLL